MTGTGREAERLQLGRERTGRFVSTNAQSGLSGYDPFAVTRFAGGTGHSKCMVDLPPLESSKIYVILNTEGDDVCH